jgi:hypothetical protein
LRKPSNQDIWTSISLHHIPNRVTYINSPYTLNFAI